VPEHGINEFVDVTVIFRGTETKILLLKVHINPVDDEMLKSVPV